MDKRSVCAVGRHIAYRFLAAVKFSRVLCYLLILSVVLSVRFPAGLPSPSSYWLTLQYHSARLCPLDPGC